MKLILIGTDKTAVEAIRSTATKYGYSCTVATDTAWRDPFDCLYDTAHYQNTVIEEISCFCEKYSKSIQHDRTSYVPRFGTFNQFLWINPKTIHDQIKPRQGYKSMIRYHRKSHMQLKTFQNIRRK